MQRNEKIILAGLFLIVFFCVFSISFYAIRSSSDEFWHLKTGEYIVQHGYHLPQKDIFAYTTADMDWVNHEWLAQVVFYKVYAAGGFHGFVWFKSLVIVLSFAMVYLVCYQRVKNHYLCLMVVLLAALASRHTLYPRPYIFSYLLVPAYLYMLYDLTQSGIKKYQYWLFPLLMMLWVNLHGGAILGILLIGFFLTGEILQWGIDRFIRRIPPLNVKIILDLFLILAITSIASLGNPYGWKVFLLTSKVMSDKRLVLSIGELLPPDFRFTTYYLGMLILVGVTVLISIRKLKPVDALLLLFFGQQSLAHVRHLPLFGITAASILVVHWEAAMAQISLWLKNPRLALSSDFKGHKVLFTIIILYLAFSILILNHQLWFNQNMLEGPGYWEDHYPVGACNFILQHPFEGHMFNEINFCGYLMFRLYPQHLVFTDNRFDLMGSKFLPDFYEITDVGPAWKETLKKYDINFMILNFHESEKLFDALQNAPEWTLIYSDRTYCIFLLNHPRNQKLFRELNIPYPG